MASGQVQLIRPIVQVGQAQNQKAEQALDQPIVLHQSLQMMETLLLGSFSCLTFLRGLLPEDCFSEVMYGGSHLNWPGATSAAQQSLTGGTGPKKGTKMKILKRGYSNEGDQLMNMLEHGIFDALRRCYLKAIQLAVYLDPAKPHIVYELYTFSFAYQDGIATGLNVKDMSGNEITATDATKNIQQLMRRLILITQNLPPLPDKRFVTIRLRYNEDTPEDYCPKHFRRILPTDKRFKYEEETDDAVLSHQMAGPASTGIHAISIKVAAFVELDESQGRRKRVRKTIIPDDEVEIPPLKNPPISPEGSAASSQVTGTPFTTKHKAQEQLLSALPRKGNEDSQVDSAPLTKRERFATPPVRSERDIRDEIRLRNMLLSPNYRKNIAETQELSPLQQLTAPYRSSPILEDEETENSNESQITPSNNGNVGKKQGIQLSKNKLAEIERLKAIKAQDDQEAIDRVVCECGDHVEDGDMSCCDVCNGWVHAHCYGYTSAKDERLNNFQVCYTCLLTNENNLLDQMKDLALFRRAIRKVWDSGYPSSNKKFAEFIGCDLPTALSITKRLEKEGFIVDTSKVRHKKKTGNYKVVKTTEIERKMNIEYFDPLMKISHHFDVPNSPPKNLDTLIRESLAVPALDTAPPKEIALEKQNHLKALNAQKNTASGSKHFPNAPTKEKTELCIPESQDAPSRETTADDEMDIDTLAPIKSLQKKVIVRATPPTQVVRAQNRRLGESPWRRLAGAAMEGIDFPSVL